MLPNLLLAALAFSPTIPDNIDVGNANWNAYPRLETRDVEVPNAPMIGTVQRLLQEGECRFEGQRPTRFSIDVNYAVMLDAQGNAARIVVEDVGCRPLEHLVGRIAALIVSDGHVRTAAPARPAYYASRVNFNLS